MITIADFPKLLSWHYGDRESLKRDLLAGIDKYRNSANPTHPEALRRVRVYGEMAALCDQPKIEPGAQMVLPFAA